ncbi:dense granule protein GRA9 [Toxoplasma gondii MAS]|uniref:Dense granule protein GRA9 n=2 Tax=Toxoplasma gondii TaxID=5811 RepID=A0A086PWE3_TOXGO|nr:dense granule protein GRA9 [Toxoplasma gondii MAS]PUA83814.1 dense granule protein GRA9 [Toxoplasma gondii TgCATBr9]
MRSLKSIVVPLSAALVAAAELDLFLGESGVYLFGKASESDVALKVPEDPVPEEPRREPEKHVDLFGEDWKQFGGSGFGDFSKVEFENLFSQVHEMMRRLMGRGVDGFGPSLLGDSPGFHFPRLRALQPKTKLEKTGTCQYVVTWAPEVTAENVRVILHLQRRQVEVQYRAATRRDEKTDGGESHSMSKEQSSQLMSVDPQCIMTREVVAQKLAGWTDNTHTATAGTPKKLLISFPSPDHIKEMVKEGYLPDNALERVLAGDFEGFSRTQMCLVSGRNRTECAFAEGQEVELEEKPLPSDSSPVTSVELPRLSQEDRGL